MILYILISYQHLDSSWNQRQLEQQYVETISALCTDIDFSTLNMLVQAGLRQDNGVGNFGG